MNSFEDRPPLANSIVVLTGFAALIIYYVYRTGGLRKETLLSFLVLIPAVIPHEIAHGALANMFGDQTAKRAGRLTLNPLRHFDPLGTFIVPGLLLFISHGSTAFGWAKPVPVDVSRMSRNKAMLVGLVGPATNVVLALLAALAFNVYFDPNRLTLHKDTYYWVLFGLLQYGHVNVLLAVYNMLPIPPLDGSSLVERLLPSRYLPKYLEMRRYALFLPLLITIGYGSFLAYLFDPAIHLWDRLLPIR